jgi:trehalose-6-phosphate synthase
VPKLASHPAIRDFWTRAEFWHPTALQCNPFDFAGLARTIGDALELDEGERRRRIERLAAAVGRRDVYWWTEQELAAAREIREAA